MPPSLLFFLDLFIHTFKVTKLGFMRLKFLLTFIYFIVVFNVNAQDEVFWSGSSTNGEWDWGTGCAANAGGNWYWNSSGTGTRQRPDCNGSFNIVKFDNSVNTIMNLNSLSDFSVNQIVFLAGTPDRTINTDASRSIYFQNNGSNCKIENYVASTTHTFNVDLFVNSGGNYMEINPVNGNLFFNNTVRNNSDNPITIYGTQQVTFSGDIAGTAGITINNTATVVYIGSSKTYSGTTTINTGTKLKISSDQTLENLVLNGGTLQIDSGATLTLTGTYTATGGTIDNKGTIKFAGDSVTFPGSATVNNGAINTLASLEAASTGIVTLNSLLYITNSISVSSGTLLLGGSDLRLNNATLSIDAGGTFDNGGENQIINGGGTINITGTFITRDTQGFVGANTAIPTITPTLNIGSTVEYGLNGDQAVQGSRSYYNLTFSNSGTKSLSSSITNTNTITGTVTIKDTAILDVDNKSFGGSGTSLTMTGTSEFRTAGTGVKPDISGTYLLGTGTKITFTNTAGTLESIRLAPIYYNIDVVGSSVGTNTATGAIDFQSGGTLTVKSSGTFKHSNTTGFSGGTQTAISNVNNPTIILEVGSTVEYAKTADQNITPFSPAYSNLTISGSGIKTTNATSIIIHNDLNITAAQLTIKDAQTFVVANKVNNSGGLFLIENNGSLVQVNDNDLNAGNITYERITPPIFRTDYTYWSSPVTDQTLYNVSPNTLAGMFYSYDASIENWTQEASSNNMIAGKGYIIRGPEQPFQDNYKASFYGKPNNGLYSITGIIEDRSYLLGNPYPSALDADSFLTANTGVLDGTLYFWTHKTPLAIGVNDPGTGIYAYSGDDYASYNTTGGTEAVSGGEKPTGKIAAAQGFFASSKATIIGTNEIVFKNSMRLDNSSAIMDNSQFFRTRNTKEKIAKTIEKHRVWLNLTNQNGIFKQTLIGYITNATNEYDGRFDGVSFDANEFVDFYSVNRDKNLVIQGRALPFDENDFVPLGFRTTIDGTFTITIDQVDGVLTNQAVFIEDKLTKTLFDLKTGNYTFNTLAGTFNDRFVLRYTNKTLGGSDLEILEKQILVSNKNKQIKVNSAVEIIDKILIFDLSGRLLFKKDEIKSYEFVIPNLISSQQTLLVKVTLQNRQTITKKIIY